MNIGLATVISKVLERFFDKKKPISLTNLATAGGSGIIYLAYLMLESGDPQLVIPSYVVGVAGIAVMLIKSFKQP